jgi:hypothetical protein
MDIYEIATAAMNRDHRRFVLIDGEILDWICMLDVNGAITVNANECRVAIIRNSSGFYEGIDTQMFYERPDKKVMLPACPDIALAGFNRTGRFFRADNSILKFIATLNAKCEPVDSDDYAVAVYQLPDGLLKAVDVRVLDAYPELHEAL